MEIREIAISDIKPATYNPRKNLKPGDAEYEKLRHAIDHFDLVEPLVWNKRTSNLVSGHQRIKVLKARGDTTVQAVILDLSDAEEKALNLALNKISGEWDLPKLEDLLRDLSNFDLDLSLTGFDPDDLTSFLSPAGTTGLTDEDETPEPPQEPVSAPGDVWLLGPHRAQVGDSTLKHAVEHLMREDRADLFFGDLPFGMDYAGGRGKANFGAIRNDDIHGEQFRSFLQRALSCAVMYKKSGAAGYVCFTWRTYDDFRSALASSGLEPAACIVWDKQHFGLGHAHYRPQHEFIFYWPGDVWYGDRNQSDVWQASRDAHVHYKHPTQKPVELIARAIRNSSKAGDLVLDLFGGSGSTLIACEKTGRIARLMELDPKYVDVIVERWQDFTGKRARLDGTSQTFEDIRSQRHEKTSRV